MTKPLFFILTLFLSTQCFAKKLIIIGDSLTEGLGVAKEQAYPSLLEKKLKNWTVSNAGVSGSTSASGLSRLKWQMKAKPDLVILALGANDGLRGVKINETEKNLTETIAYAKQNNIKIILAGMQLPPNYGKEYTSEFKKTFYKIAKKEKVLLIPFILDKVAGDFQLNQADGIHPNEKGHEVIAETLYQFLKDKI